MNRIGLYIVAIAMALLPMTSRADAWTRTVIYRLPRENPIGGLISDRAGNLYGIANSDIFKLTPPKAGQTTWTKTVLHTVNAGPPLRLLMDEAGDFYGVTYATGLLAGSVFKLAHPTAGQTAWTETVLHTFDSLHYRPSSGLTMDGAGNLYGAVVTSFEGYGVVYKLARPAAGKTAWTETALAPVVHGGGVVFDQAGNLYGTDADTGADQKPTCPGPDCGSVFKLTPPAGGEGAWQKMVIHRFTGGANGALPQGPLSIGAAGVIYGATAAGGNGSCPSSGPGGCGTVFKLVPPAPGKSNWTETVLYRFNPIGLQGPTPVGGLSFDRAGNLYGVTQSNDATKGRGAVYRLTRPSAANSAWGYSILSQFYGTRPQDGLLIGPHGAIFGATAAGDGSSGIIYRLTP